MEGLRKRMEDLFSGTQQSSSFPLNLLQKATEIIHMFDNALPRMKKNIESSIPVLEKDYPGSGVHLEWSKNTVINQARKMVDKLENIFQRYGEDVQKLKELKQKRSMVLLDQTVAAAAKDVKKYNKLQNMLNDIHQEMEQIVRKIESSLNINELFNETNLVHAKVRTARSQAESSRQFKQSIRAVLKGYVIYLWRIPKSFIVGCYKLITKLVKGEKGSSRFKAAFNAFKEEIHSMLPASEEARISFFLAIITIAAFIGALIYIGHKTGLLEKGWRVVKRPFTYLKNVIVKLFGKKEAEEFTNLELQYIA